MLMYIYTSYAFLIITSLTLFALGNLVYAPILNLPWYVRSIISEFIFVLMYTLVDFGNIKYKYKFTFPHLILLLSFYLPTFLPLFYSVTVQFFSTSIAILAVLVNSKVLNILYNKGLTKILCSRASTTFASIVDILLFSFILDTGLVGALLMTILRPVYIIIVSKIIFRSNL